MKRPRIATAEARTAPPVVEQGVIERVSRRGAAANAPDDAQPASGGQRAA
jgi:hypothetical protein